MMSEFAYEGPWSRRLRTTVQLSVAHWSDVSTVQISIVYCGGSGGNGSGSGSAQLLVPISEPLAYYVRPVFPGRQFRS